MQNIKKYKNIYHKTSNGSIDYNLKVIINGQYERTMNKDDLELTRFMIGGMDGK